MQQFLRVGSLWLCDGQESYLFCLFLLFLLCRSLHAPFVPFCIILWGEFPICYHFLVSFLRVFCVFWYCCILYSLHLYLLISVRAINLRACLPSPVYCNFFFFIIKYLFLTMQSITALHPLAFGRQKKIAIIETCQERRKEVGPSPADGPLRPIVCCTTQQHNRQVRAGRGVNLAGFDWTFFVCMYISFIHHCNYLFVWMPACRVPVSYPLLFFFCFFPFPVLFHYCFLFIYCWIICLRCRCLPVAYLIHINIFTFIYSLLHCRHLFTCMPACRLPLFISFF